jgi:hypothetical protein
MTNRCVKELVDLLMYSRLTPTCFGKWLPSSGSRKPGIHYKSTSWLCYNESSLVLNQAEELLSTGLERKIQTRRAIIVETANTMHCFVPIFCSMSIHWLLHVSAVVCHHQGASSIQVTWNTNGISDIPYNMRLRGLCVVVPTVVLPSWMHNRLNHDTPVHSRRSPHTTSLNTTRPSTALQLWISQKALGTLPEDGNVRPKHVGATVHN